MFWLGDSIKELKEALGKLNNVDLEAMSKVDWGNVRSVFKGVYDDIDKVNMKMGDLEIKVAELASDKAAMEKRLSELERKLG